MVPALVGAVLILLTGYFLARQVQRWADDTLKRLDFNKVAPPAGSTRWSGAPAPGWIRCARWPS